MRSLDSRIDTRQRSLTQQMHDKLPPWFYSDKLALTLTVPNVHTTYYIQTSIIRASVIRSFWGQNLVRPTYMKYSQISIIRTSIIRGPRLSAGFETKIGWATFQPPVLHSKFYCISGGWNVQFWYQQWTFQPPTFQPPYKSRLAMPILQRMKFNLLYLFARALSVESYCLHYVFKLFVRKICVR